ncbi:LCP family protein [Gordonia neofelifaecis]|uniref:Cell envelope-like function transcriptional attenuator n=1 Tax=Gordonia neofelifaecis NRRL B-59395 TaxID=644548 RepID=F1YNZ4_9ACTN|nr:LCP family protein [Gordonia neofelifaecis]EGD53613.1 cell envelope-like function transcriptional attenuator [Gordonia neofelifaecis NRRL B-59395]
MSSDRPGSPEPDDDASAQSRRPRRAGRASGAYDFRERFGDAPPPPSGNPPIQRADGLREPSSREGYVRPRGRLTVRQLMEQMGVDETGAPTTPQAGRRPQPPRGPRPDPRRQSPPPVARPPQPQPPIDEAAANEVTQMIPPVADASSVDLSDTTTAARLSQESRAQRSTPPPATRPAAETRVTRSPAAMAAEAEASAGADEPAAPVPTDPAADSEDTASTRRRPLQPTPDLTDALSQVRRRRRRRPTGKERTRKVATNTGRILLGLACALSLVGTGYAWNMMRSINGGWNVVNALDPNNSNVRDLQGQYGDETYLIVGTDTRSGKNSKLGAGDADTVEGSRSDTVLLVNIPADRSRVVAVSWPRDLAVDRPECQNWDNGTQKYSGTLEAASSTKLNGVYADGGPACLVKTLTQISGLNINHFIAMDFSGFEDVVRTVGGVQVCSTVPLYDYELGTILKKAGSKKLTGRQALNYVRARHISEEGNGDYGRIKRQQLFMSSLLRASLSSDVLSNPSKLNKVARSFISNSYVDNVDTDSLIQLAESMQGMEAGRVTFLTVPTSGTSTDGENNEIPRMDDIDAIFNAIIDDKPLPGEKKNKPASTKKADATPKAPAPKTDLTAQYPSNMSVRVLNGTDQSGLAGSVMEELVRQGLDVSGIADSSEKRTDTVVRYGPGEKDSAATIAKMFPGAQIQQDSTVKAGVEVIVGSDFGGVETITTLPSPGSVLAVGELPANTDNSDLPSDLSVTNAGDTTCA